MRKTLITAAITAFVCSLLLSSANYLLKERISNSKKDELCRRVLATFTTHGDNPQQQFSHTFSEAIVFENGSSKSVPATTMLRDNFKSDRFVLIPKNTENPPIAHLVGKGLWGEIRGFVALNKDSTTISGLAFYQSSETPGLGAQFSEPEVLARFKDKRIGENFRVVQPPGNIDEFSVDGVSGATITGRAIEKMLKEQASFYRQQLKRREKK